MANSNTGVLLGTGGVFLGGYAAGLFPKVKEYSPGMLMDSSALIYGVSNVQDYTKAVIVTGVLCVICFMGSMIILNKKQI